MIYTFGTTVELSATFRVGGTLTDPTTLTCVIQSPSGITTTLTYGVDAALVKDSTGIYHTTVLANEASTTTKRWNYRFTGTGTAAGLQESWFDVAPASF